MTQKREAARILTIVDRPVGTPGGSIVRFVRGGHIESRMVVRLSRSLWVGWTGLGRATPLGGQARIRSHRPENVGGWESTGHYQDSI